MVLLSGERPTTSSCDDHPFEPASGTCSDCRRCFCPTCLVYASSHQSPLCIPCALTAAGIRRTAARPRLGNQSPPRPPDAQASMLVARLALGLVLVAGVGLAGLNIVTTLG